MTGEQPTGEATHRPVQITGPATDEEVAAVVLVLSALTGGSEPAKPREMPRWGHPGQLLRKPLPVPGTQNWDFSTR